MRYLLLTFLLVLVLVTPAQAQDVGALASDQYALQSRVGTFGGGFVVQTALSADGSTAAIASPYYNIDNAQCAHTGWSFPYIGGQQGAVWVYTRTGTTWTLQQQITLSAAQPCDYFGYGIALSRDGTTLLVGAPGRDFAPEQLCNSTPADMGSLWTQTPVYYDAEGAVYVYKRGGATWSLTQTLSRPDAQPCDSFGTSVVINSNSSLAVVAASGRDTTAGSNRGALYDYLWNSSSFTAGAVLENLQLVQGLSGTGMTLLANGRVYARSGSTWALQSVLGSGAGALSDDGGTALVGNRVYRQATNWALEATLTGIDTTPEYDSFGSSVALNGDGSLALIGAMTDEMPGMLVDSNIGSVYAFARSGANWAQVQEFFDPAWSDAGRFGHDVALDAAGVTAFVGSAPPGEIPGTASAFVRSAPADTNLVFNGDFGLPLAGYWDTWNSSAAIANGMLSIARTSSSGGFVQFVPNRVPSGTPLELKWQMGNFSGTAQQFTMILRNAAWSNMQTCVFTLPAFSPMQHYTLRITTNSEWFPITVQGWLEGTGAPPAITVDNIQLYRRAAGGGAPCGVVPPADTNLIFDGAFDQGMTNYAPFGAVTTQVTGGVLQLTRQASSGDSGIFQFNPYGAPANAPLEFSLRLGNNSPVFKSVAVVLRHDNWSDSRICYINLPAGSPLATYTMRLRTSIAWPNIMMQLYVLQADGLSAIQIDDLNLRYRPALALANTLECPPSSPSAGEPSAPVMGDGGTAPVEALPPALVVPEDAKP